MPIDYARMQSVFPKQKAALTRAKKKGYAAVLEVCRAAVCEWDQIGAWPDNWSLFQRTLDDMAFSDSSGKWCGNALRFATRKEAEDQVRDLMYRWFAVRDTRVVESADPVNYAYVNGRLESLEVAK